MIRVSLFGLFLCLSFNVAGTTVFSSSDTGLASSYLVELNKTHLPKFVSVCKEQDKMWILIVPKSGVGGIIFSFDGSSILNFSEITFSKDVNLSPLIETNGSFNYDKVKAMFEKLIDKKFNSFGVLVLSEILRENGVNSCSNET